MQINSASVDRDDIIRFVHRVRHDAFKANVLVGRDASDLCILRDVLKHGIATVHASNRVLSRVFVNRHSIPKSAMGFINQVAANKREGVVITNRTHARDRLAIEFSHEKTIGVRDDKRRCVVDSRILTSMTHARNQNLIDLALRHRTNRVATARKIPRSVTLWIKSFHRAKQRSGGMSNTKDRAQRTGMSCGVSVRPQRGFRLMLALVILRSHGLTWADMGRGRLGATPIARTLNDCVA